MWLTITACCFCALNRGHLLISTELTSATCLLTAACLLTAVNHSLTDRFTSQPKRNLYRVLCRVQPTSTNSAQNDL